MIGYGYKEWENMECFENQLNSYISSILYNIFYYIVEWFYLIHRHKHGWSNHVKTSCTICVIVLSLYSWTNIVGIKAFAGITSGIRAWVEDFWKSKRSQSTQDENKRNFSWRWSRLLSRGDMIHRAYVLERLKIDLMEFGPRWRLLGIVPNS